MLAAQNVEVNSSNLYSSGRDQYVTNNWISNHDADRERQTIADWLTSLNDKQSQSRFLREWERGTGQWLLESQKFKDWRDGVSATLWCPGDAGTGKTILASIVVDHLETIFEGDDKVTVACIFCNYKEQTEQTDSGLVASLLKQIVLASGANLDKVKSLYSRHKRKGTHPRLDELSTVLNSEIETYSKVFVIVDALDECREDDGTRAKFLKVLQSLPMNVNLMVTSRNLSSLARDFDGKERLDIRATHEDVKGYIESRVSLARRHIQELQGTIVSKILENVDGMFLLARLHLDSLLDKLNAEDVLEALECLPKGVYETHNEAMERIDRQDERCRQLAKRVLLWITFAFRPLSVAELQHALAVKMDTAGLNPRAIFDEELLTSVCVGLVVLDKQPNVVRLVHYTTQQYFERERGSRFPNAHASITATCLTYLAFDIFKRDEPFNDIEGLESLLHDHAFLDYAIHYWGHHARQQKTGQNDVMILNFLQDKAKVSCPTRVLPIVVQSKNTWFDINGDEHYLRNLSGIHVSSFFGLEEIIKYQLENGAEPDLKDGHDRTPLSLAAKNGHEEVVKLLLARDDVYVNSRDSHGRTPLLLGAEYGHGAVVGLLLSRSNVSVNVKDDFDRTPLLVAAESGYEDVTEMLLRRVDVDANVKGRFNSTPLSLALQGQHEKVTKLLLARNDIEVNSGCRCHYDLAAPLWLAARRGLNAEVKLLLARDDINVNTEDQYGMTPLSVAASLGHSTVVKLLLARDDVDRNSKNKQYGLSWSAGRTPLSFAAEGGHEAVVKLLLACDNVEVNSEDSYSGRTPLDYAAEARHEGIIKLLLAKGAIHQQNHNFQLAEPCAYGLLCLIS